MKRAPRILWAILRSSVGVTLLVYLGVSGAIKWSALWGLASAWRIGLLVLILLMLEQVVGAWRLCVLFAPRGFRLSLSSAIRLTLVGIFFNSFLPGSGGGDVVKVFYAAHGNRGRRMELMTILLLDRAVGMFTLLIWPLVLLLFFPRVSPSMAILNRLLLMAGLTAGAMLLGASVCFSTRLRNSRLFSRIVQIPFGGHLMQMFDTIHAYRNDLGALWRAVGISLLGHTITIAAILLGARATVSSAIAWKASVLIPLGMLVNSLPFTPGGIGVGEAAFDALFKAAGISGGAQTLLAWRLLMFVISFFGFVCYLQGRRQYVFAVNASSTADTEA